MKRRLTKSDRFRWATVSAILVALCLTAGGMLYMQSKLGELTSVPGKDPVWMSSQLEFELARFLGAVVQFQHASGHEQQHETISNESDDREALAKNVVKRFDILWSRYLVMTEARIGRQVAQYEGGTEKFERFGEDLRRYGPVVLSIKERDTLETDRLIAGFGGHVDALHDLTLKMLATRSERNRALRGTITNVAGSLVQLSLATVIAGIVGMSIFWISERRARAIMSQNEILLEEAAIANEAKSRFISVTSHELRTPLTSISGALALMKAGIAGQAGSELKTMIEIAHSNSKRLSHVVDDLLDYEKNNAGMLEYSFAPVELSSLAHEAAESNKIFGDMNGVKFRVIAPEEPVFVNGDRNRLMQVLTNLLSNAAKFSHPNSTVDVTVGKLKNKAKISVRDYGIGIPKDSRPKVFETFAQIDPTNKRGKGGTGLGMSISKAIVEHHGGVIDFLSQVDKGTTFFVILDAIDNPIEEPKVGV